MSVMAQASISDAGSEKPLGRLTHPASQRVYHLCDGKAVFYFKTEQNEKSAVPFGAADLCYQFLSMYGVLSTPFD